MNSTATEPSHIQGYCKNCDWDCLWGSNTCSFFLWHYPCESYWKSLRNPLTPESFLLFYLLVNEKHQHLNTAFAKQYSPTESQGKPSHSLSVSYREWNNVNTVGTAFIKCKSCIAFCFFNWNLILILDTRYNEYTFHFFIFLSACAVVSTFSTRPWALAVMNRAEEPIEFHVLCSYNSMSSQLTAVHSLQRLCGGLNSMHLFVSECMGRLAMGIAVHTFIHDTTLDMFLLKEILMLSKFPGSWWKENSGSSWCLMQKILM